MENWCVFNSLDEANEDGAQRLPCALKPLLYIVLNDGMTSRQYKPTPTEKFKYCWSFKRIFVHEAHKTGQKHLHLDEA